MAVAALMGATVVMCSETTGELAESSVTSLMLEMRYRWTGTTLG